MIQLPARFKVFATLTPTDMRKSFCGLIGIVEKELGQQIETGDLFLFFNRSRNRLKVLFFTGDGTVIVYKKLEWQSPHFFLFTEFGGNANNLPRWPSSAGRMDSNSSGTGPRRRPMSREIAVTAPPRADFAENWKIPLHCGVG